MLHFRIHQVPVAFASVCNSMTKWQRTWTKNWKKKKRCKRSIFRSCRRNIHHHQLSHTNYEYLLSLSFEFLIASHKLNCISRRFTSLSLSLFSSHKFTHTCIAIWNQPPAPSPIAMAFLVILVRAHIQTTYLIVRCVPNLFQAVQKFEERDFTIQSIR